MNAVYAIFAARGIAPEATTSPICAPRPGPGGHCPVCTAITPSRNHRLPDFRPAIPGAPTAKCGVARSGLRDVRIPHGMRSGVLPLMLVLLSPVPGPAEEGV